MTTVQTRQTVAVIQFHATQTMSLTQVQATQTICEIQVHALHAQLHGHQSQQSRYPSSRC
ncbi:hypothetical protein A5784_18110 [Mycobacterium sp. 852013-50091_SCH5140682]|nr:hypothetical protein A5784_18110 [Mycobacterium sp. 852013-50091_SCH5140682]